MEDITEYIVGDGLILIPALMVIGKILKESVIFPDRWIPLFLLPLGILGAVGLIGLTGQAVIQGILVTGMAVYGNQIFKQLIHKDKPEGSRNDQ